MADKTVGRFDTLTQTWIAELLHDILGDGTQYSQVVQATDAGIGFATSRNLTAATKQKIRVTVTTSGTTVGNASAIVTAAGMSGSPITVSVAVANSDTDVQVAGKVVTGLQANSTVNAFFDSIAANGAVITMEAAAGASNDTTMSLEVKNGTSGGLGDVTSTTILQGRQAHEPITDTDWRLTSGHGPIVITDAATTGQYLVLDDVSMCSDTNVQVWIRGVTSGRVLWTGRVLANTNLQVTTRGKLRVYTVTEALQAYADVAANLAVNCIYHAEAAP